jgi:HTH-type transcriptional regulator/antitoxin HigA
MTSALIENETYGGLLTQALPRVIRTEEENDRYIQMLEDLYASAPLTPEKETLAELLALLIGSFEAKAYSLPGASPVEVVQALMESNNLKQSDMTDIFGSPSVISEVLSGKRQLSKTHIQRLGARFRVPTDVFFPSAQS